jgi:hypothetical protein
MSKKAARWRDCQREDAWSLYQLAIWIKSEDKPICDLTRNMLKLDRFCLVYSLAHTMGNLVATIYEEVDLTLQSSIRGFNELSKFFGHSSIETTN